MPSMRGHKSHAGEWYAHKAEESGKTVENILNGRLLISANGEQITVPHGYMGAQKEAEVIEFCKKAGIKL